MIDVCYGMLWYAMIDEWLGFGMINAMIICLDVCVCVCVCVSIDTVLNMPLIGLRHKTQ